MPFAEGKTIRGWGVCRSDPWHFVGIFASKDAAESKAAELGDGYIARFGENREGTDDFMWSSSDNPDA